MRCGWAGRHIPKRSSGLSRVRRGGLQRAGIRRPARHAPSNVNNASLEPLASNDLATDEEIRILQAAHARVLACRQTFLNAVAQHAPNISAIDAAIAARTDVAMMALIQKKITWGEYLRQW